MKTNKSLVRALSMVGLELISIERNEKLYNSHGYRNVTKDSEFGKKFGVDEMTGHLIVFRAKRIGTAGNMVSIIGGTMYLNDHMTSSPTFSIEFDYIEKGGKVFIPDEYLACEGEIKIA